jgi:hypothetical protein
LLEPSEENVPTLLEKNRKIPKASHLLPDLCIYISKIYADIIFISDQLIIICSRVKCKDARHSGVRASEVDWGCASAEVVAALLVVLNIVGLGALRLCEKESGFSILNFLGRRVSQLGALAHPWVHAIEPAASAFHRSVAEPQKFALMKS